MNDPQLSVNARLRLREAVRHSQPVRERWSRTINPVGPFTPDAPKLTPSQLRKKVPRKGA